MVLLDGDGAIVSLSPSRPLTRNSDRESSSKIISMPKERMEAPKLRLSYMRSSRIS